ncbi:MAG TPA: prolyl-tRNA synthetase associated domain-containing protein [Caulobacterales bacterium]|nr:prolyl-tRNA synthetase associated domain-containing protein [Caulobacterales bacterium]
MSTARPEELFAYLDRIGVAHRTIPHRPVFTVDEGRDLKASMPGGHSKNLFLKDKRGALFLLCALGETKIDLNAVSKLVGAGRFSFGSAELLQQTLGVTPGSVTIFALLNDTDHKVRLLLDRALLEYDPVHFHPLTNDASTAVSPDGLLAFLRSLGRDPVLLAFDSDGAPTLID